MQRLIEGAPLYRDQQGRIKEYPKGFMQNNGIALSDIDPTTTAIAILGEGQYVAKLANGDFIFTNMEEPSWFEEEKPISFSFASYCLYIKTTVNTYIFVDNRWYRLKNAYKYVVAQGFHLYGLTNDGKTMLIKPARQEHGMWMAVNESISEHYQLSLPSTILYNNMAHTIAISDDRRSLTLIFPDNERFYDPNGRNTNQEREGNCDCVTIFSANELRLGNNERLLLDNYREIACGCVLMSSLFGIPTSTGGMRYIRRVAPETNRWVVVDDWVPYSPVAEATNYLIALEGGSPARADNYQILSTASGWPTSVGFSGKCLLVFCKKRQKQYV